ncbi:hypothetical protein [Thiomicrorhabdus indica]|uniref:hypothetical protein n=1 Tax=Thiomicrorhabdus indica TaxID=2267253 RepID=UPI002AA61595|nr:hypothetical protein [Thiomicrorhabdus indica]
MSDQTLPENQSPNIPADLMPQDFDSSIPSPEEMLARLHSVDLQQYDSEAIFQELKGKYIWISAMTIPITVITLALFTLGGLIFDQPIIGFIIGALLLFWISRMIDAKDQNLRFEAHNVVIERIKNTEGDFGLIPHFKHFLPQRYRHLWQSLKKGNYQYIEQYIQAVHLLQTKLVDEKFIHIWQLKYPQFAATETLPEEPEQEEPQTSHKPNKPHKSKKH